MVSIGRVRALLWPSQGHFSSSQEDLSARRARPEGGRISGSVWSSQDHYYERAGSVFDRHLSKECHFRLKKEVWDEILSNLT